MYFAFKASTKVKEHLKAGDSIPKDSEETSDRWAKKRKLFKESRQWGSAEESSTSNITDESGDNVIKVNRESVHYHRTTAVSRGPGRLKANLITHA